MPDKANDKQPDQQLQMHVQGEIAHGHSRNMFVSFKHVRGGANLAVHVCLLAILRRLESCLEDGVKFPTIYTGQIDGGPENANFTYYTLFYILVMLRIFRLAQLARLPPGHGHEDDDSFFGNAHTINRKGHCNFLNHQLRCSQHRYHSSVS